MSGEQIRVSPGYRKWLEDQKLNFEGVLKKPLTMPETTKILENMNIEIKVELTPPNKKPKP